MMESNIINLIKLVKKSEKQQKQREAFVQFVLKSGDNQPESILREQINNIFVSVFSGGNPVALVENMKSHIDENKPEAFLDLFSFESRAIATQMFEYKQSKKALDSFFAFTMFNNFSSSYRFIQNLQYFQESEKLPPMIGPMVKPKEKDPDSFGWNLSTFSRAYDVKEFYGDWMKKGVLSLRDASCYNSYESIQNNLFKNAKGFVYRDVNAFGTITEKGSFSLMGFKGDVYNPRDINQENCIFPIQRIEDYGLGGEQLVNSFKEDLFERMKLLYQTKSGENVNSSLGLDVSISALLETAFVPIVLSGLVDDSLSVPIKLTIDKQGTSVYVDSLELFSVLGPLSQAILGMKNKEKSKDIVNLYFDSKRNSIIIDSEVDYKYVTTFTNWQEGTVEEKTNLVPFCGEVKCLKEAETRDAKSIATVELTNLSPTITLKEKLSDKPVIVEYLEVPAKIFRENPGLKQFQDKENDLLKIKNEKELYQNLIAFIEKYVNTYAPLQEKEIVQQVGGKQKEQKALVRWLDESKPQFDIKTNPNISKYVLTVRESYWQNNTALDIESTLAYFVSQGANPYYRLLSIQILGIDYLKFTEKIAQSLIENGILCVSDLVISEDTRLPLYFGVLPYQVEYRAEYVSGNVYKKQEKLQEIEMNVKTYFGNTVGTTILMNQNDYLEKAKPELMKFRWTPKAEVIERYISNKDLSKEDQVKYKIQDLKTITLDVKSQFVYNYGYIENFGLNITADYFIDWLSDEGGKYIKSSIQVNTEEGGGVSLVRLILDGYIKPLQKGIFINKHLKYLLLGKRNYKTEVVDSSSKETVEIKIYHKGDSENSISLSRVSGNGKTDASSGLTKETREKLQEMGYIGPDNETFKRGRFKEEHITIKKDEAKRIWNILETLYYEKTSDIKVEGQRLYNLFVRSKITDKNLLKASKLWCSLYNNFAKPDYTLIPTIIRHSYYFKTNTTTPFNLRGAQKQGLKFLNAYENGGLLAHEVGFGKTTTAITKCVELLETGKANRILTIVPNVVYDNWIQEISGGKDKDGNVIIGLLGNSVKVIPIGNLGLSDLRGKKRPSRTEIQKAIIKKDGKYKGVKTYFDETDKGQFDEVGAIKKASEVSQIILDHIGAFSRERGSKLKGVKGRVSKLNDGALIRYSDRKIEGSFEVMDRGSRYTINIDRSAEEFDKDVAKNINGDSMDLRIGRRRFSGNADITNFVEFVKEVLSNEIPDYTESPALNSIVPDILEIAQSIQEQFFQELREIDSDLNKSLKSAYAYSNYYKKFEIKDYCGINVDTKLAECNDEYAGYQNRSSGPEELPTFTFWINKEYTNLEKKLTDRIIWYFRKLRGVLVGKMGTWKEWAVRDRAILLAKHSAIENIKVPQIYVNQAIIDASDVKKLESASAFYKGFALPLRHNSIDVNTLNVDALIVDEAHNFNRIIDKVNRRFGSRLPLQRGFGKPRNNKEGDDYVNEYSFKSNSLPTVNKFNLFCLAKYIQGRKKENMNTILLSATPFTDDNYQLLSLFNMIDKNRMETLSINNAYDFYINYVQEEWKWDINQRNQFGLFAKVEGYNNGYALSSFIKSFGNFKISDKEIERRRPIKYTISSSRQSLEQIKDVVSIIDLTDVQERMVKNISAYTNGDTTNVNEYGFDKEMIKKAKTGKRASKGAEVFVDEEKELKLQDEITKLVEVESFSTDAREKFFELSNLNPNSMWVEDFKESNKDFFEEGEEDEADQTDGSDAVKSGALGDSESTAKSFRGQSMNLRLAISPYLLSGNKEGTLMNPLLPAFTKNESVNAKNFVEQSPKINYAVKCSLELLLHHKSKNEKPSGQVFYLNLVRFTYGGMVLNIFELITKYMVDICADPKSKYFGLLDESQIKGVTSDTTSANREEIKNKFLSGEVLILMGTETIKEGINLQENATVMYILNAEFSPVKMMQLQGRIWRQGNNWKNCFIINVLARKSLDAFVFSKLDKKITAVREMLDSDVYEMDATQFTMDAQQIKIELTTDVKQLVKIGWIEREKLLESQRIQEKVKLNSLESLKNNYLDDLQKSAELKERFNNISMAYSVAVFDEMIKKIIRRQDKIAKDEAIAKKQSSSKTPLTTEQLKNIKYKKTTDKEAEALVNQTDEYSLKYEHEELTDDNLSYVVLSTQLKKLLEGLLVVDTEYINIKQIERLSKESVAGKSLEFKTSVTQAGLDIETIEKELSDPLIPIEKLSFGRRMIRVMRAYGYEDRYEFFGVKFTQFEDDVDKLIGGTGIAKTLSDYSVYVEGQGKTIADIDSLINIQQKVYDKAVEEAKDEEGEKKKLTAYYTKELAAKNDPKKKVGIEKALKRFVKIFPLIQKR